MRRIPVGIHYFTRRVLSKEEAGIIHSMPGVLQLEYIQYYFHIYLIPVIPTSAGWYARYEDGTLEKMENDIAKQLNEIYHPRFSLWACLGPLGLAAAIILAFLGRVLFDYYTSFDQFDNSRDDRQALFAHVLEPAIGDYYFFDSNVGSWGAAKVTAFNEDTVQLLVLHRPGYEWKNEEVASDFVNKELPVLRIDKVALAQLIDMNAEADTLLMRVALNKCRLKAIQHYINED